MTGASAVSARPIRSVTVSSAASACCAWMIAVSLVTCAVTNGLPSRSPPTQLPKRRNAGAAAGTRPQAAPVEHVIQ